MTGEPAAATVWYSAFDSLRRTQPDVATALAARFPGFSNEILGRRVFGVSQTPSADRQALSRAAVEAVAVSVTKSLEEVLSVARRRARNLARLRLCAGSIALVCSAVVVAALSQHAIPTTAVCAIAASVASALNLLATYYEDRSGGEGSVARMRDTLLDQVGALAEIRGKLTLGLMKLDDASVVSAMTVLNAISSRLQLARARLGLPLSAGPAWPASAACL